MSIVEKVGSVAELAGQVESVEKEEKKEDKTKDKGRDAALAKYTYLKPDDLQKVESVLKTVNQHIRQAWTKQVKEDFAGIVRRSDHTEYMVAKMRGTYLELFQALYRSAKDCGLGSESFFYPHELLQAQYKFWCYPHPWQIRPWFHHPDGWELYMKCKTTQQILGLVGYDNGNFYLQKCCMPCMEYDKDNVLHNKPETPVTLTAILAHFSSARMSAFDKRWKRDQDLSEDDQSCEEY